MADIAVVGLAAGDLDLRVAQAVHSRYAEAMRDGRGAEDNSALLATILGQ